MRSARARHRSAPLRAYQAPAPAANPRASRSVAGSSTGGTSGDRDQDEDVRIAAAIAMTFVDRELPAARDYPGRDYERECDQGSERGEPVEADGLANVLDVGDESNRDDHGQK